MISFRKPTDPLEQLQSLLKATVECYTLAVQSVTQYAIEIDPDENVVFRAHLEKICNEWRDADSADARHSVQASFRGEMREYRDQSRQRLDQMRSQIQSSVAAVSAFIGGIEASGSEHEASMKQGLDHLSRAGKSSDVGQIHAAIDSAVDGIHEAMEHMRRANQMAIVNLQDEIRSLHREFQAERRRMFTDPHSGAWTREKADAKLDELLRQNQPFCFLVVSIGNLKDVQYRHPRSIVDGSLRALVKRFHGLVGPDIFIARWSEDGFAAILDLSPADVAILCRDARVRLGGKYSVQDDGKAYELTMQLTTTMLEYNAAHTADDFHRQLDQFEMAVRT